ncbi:hypothetical protein BX666DRAFT_1941313 [Dichotomocladium elegans]|nr:hypothetical protein BX666DRAFT_1941313 [Dichotomocladium elegans]
MFKSLRKALGRNSRKGAKSSTRQNSQQSTMSSNSDTSFATATTITTSSPPLTPTAPVVHETRGIFRTLEPAWYYYDSNDGHWVAFEQSAQAVIESAYVLNEATVTLEQPAMTLDLHSSRNRNSGNDKTKWVLDKTIRRIVAPVWWFEQDSVLDGSKGMCRFDYKNQVRLEALSSDDDERTQLILTDASFPQPFTVSLDYSMGRDLKEAWRGFLYLEVPVVPQYYFYDDAKQNPCLEPEPFENGLVLCRRFSI